ncbi:hypothetical protein DL765_005175 [Monosporascus sp. GIB2]|nr:hypothetical protein DL765_005175 [Monosporascus sp. GIB2]
MSSDPRPSFTPSWQADSADETSCKYAGEFFATWMTTPEQIEAQTYRGPGMTMTAEYLRVLFNRPREDGTVTDGQLLQWFADEEMEAQRAGDGAYEQFLISYVQPALTNCGASVCRSLGWDGNADLAGIGVFTSYYIEAILATIFFIVLLAWRSKENRPRLLVAFLETLNDLAYGVFLFSIAVMFASLHYVIVARNDPNSVTTYETITSTLVSVFSICPAILMYQMARWKADRETRPEDKLKTKQAKRLQLVILFVLWALMLAIVNLGRDRDPNATAIEAGSIGHPFELFCPVLAEGYHEVIRIIVDGVSGLGLICLLVLAFYKRRAGDETKRPKFIRVVSLGLPLLAWIAMWLFLGVFTVLRARIIEVAGASDESNEWGFGQIVALATWVPVISKFVYTLWVKFGPAGEGGGADATQSGGLGPEK